MLGKALCDVIKLEKGLEDWDKRCFDFKVASGSISPEMRTTSEVIKGLAEEIDMKKVRAMDPARAERIGLPQRSAELYRIMVLKTVGEAKLMVKSVVDNDGLRAWLKLHRHCHRRTFAKAMRDHREVLYPRRLKRMDEVVTAVMGCEDMLKAEKVYDDIPKILKIAALVEILPSEIKDMVFP